MNRSDIATLGLKLVGVSAIVRALSPTEAIARISQAAPVLQLRGSQAQEYFHTSSAG